MERLAAIADALGRFSSRYVPSAFSIAVILTALTFGLALWLGNADCINDPDCASGQFCDEGLCQPLERQCAADRACAGGCVRGAAKGAPAVCRVACTLRADCAGAADRPLCVGGYCRAQDRPGPLLVLRGWGDGLWELLTFAMQMALIMFCGYVVAVSRPVSRALTLLAGLARSPRSAVVLMALASMGLGLVNWGLSIVGSAMLVRYVVRRRPEVDYRLLVAAAYLGLGATWHAGLSASAPLLVATPGHFLESQLGIVPVAKTLGSPFNLALVAVSVAVLAVLVGLMHPRPERTVRVSPATLSALGEFVPPAPMSGGTFVQRLDSKPYLNWLLGGAGVAYLVWSFGFAGAGVNVNLVNFAFLTAAILLHGSPASLVKAAEEAASVLHGIVLQFPLYAGMYGVFKATGLTDRIGSFFVAFSTADTFPAIVYWYSGIVNYFVPSGGSKWAIEAPYLLSAASRLGVPAHKVVLAYAWGDMATDLIQPFWALPLLAVARLDFKDILGYLLVLCLVYVPLVSIAFLFFFP